MGNYFDREFIIYFCAAPVAGMIFLTHVSRRISFSKSRFHVNVIGENIFELLNGFFGTILRLLNDLFDIPIFFRRQSAGRRRHLRGFECQKIVFAGKNKCLLIFYFDGIFLEINIPPCFFAFIVRFPRHKNLIYRA